MDKETSLLVKQHKQVKELTEHLAKEIDVRRTEILELLCDDTLPEAAKDELSAVLLELTKKYNEIANTPPRIVVRVKYLTMFIFTSILWISGMYIWLYQPYFATSQTYSVSSPTFSKGTLTCPIVSCPTVTCPTAAISDKWTEFSGLGFTAKINSQTSWSAVFMIITLILGSYGGIKLINQLFSSRLFNKKKHKEEIC